MNKIVWLLLSVIIIFHTSCTVEKRLYMSGYNVIWKRNNINLDNENTFRDVNFFTTEGEKNSLFIEKTGIAETEENFTASIDNACPLKNINNNYLKSIKTGSSKLNEQITYVNSIIDSCDNIILKNGEEIWAKYIELGANEITYKNCDNLNGQTLTIKTADVLLIKYSNGTKDIFENQKSTKIGAKDIYASQTSTPINEKKILTSALVSFIFSIVGFIIFGIPLGITSVIIGIISLNRINKYPEKYNGRGFAITGMILGFVDIIAVLIILSML